MERLNLTLNKQDALLALKKSKKEIGINSLSALIRFLLKQFIKTNHKNK